MIVATLTIRNLDEEVKRDIGRAAAERGVSMEQEARDRLARPRRSRRAGSGEVSAEEILRRYARKPDEPFDLKRLTDEIWDEGLRRIDGDRAGSLWRCHQTPHSGWI